MGSVTLKNISKTYISKKEKVEAVKNLNLEVKDGEFMCLLGPSGCGKTTSMRMIVGLEDITKGEIYIDGILVNAMSPQERNVAMSFETYALYTHLSVKENIAFPLRAKKVPKIELEKRLERVVKMLELEDFLDRNPSQLSGGQQQRVSLARALIREPSVFLLDEPLSHLDVALRTSTRAQIKHLHHELKTTFIYVTHDQLEAISLADRIAVMNFAILQQVGSREELLDYPINKFVADFIGEPAINLFDGKILKGTDGKLELLGVNDELKIEIPKAWLKGLAEYIDKEVIIGIRPHDLVLEKVEGYSKISGVTDVFEFLGEESHITMMIGGHWLTAVVGADVEFAVGQSIDLYIQADRIHLFDKESEACISTQIKLDKQE